MGLSHDSPDDKNGHGSVRLLPIEVISAHAPRLRNAPLAKDAAAVERAWEAAVWDGKRKLATEYKQLMGMLDNVRWIDPKKLDKSVNNLITALPASTATNAISPLKSALSDLQSDFIAAVSAQNISYTPMPPAAGGIVTFIPATMYATATATPSGMALPLPATIDVQPAQGTAGVSDPNSADAVGSGEDSSAAATTTAALVGVLAAFGCAVVVAAF
ncbi:hypothetical protein HDU86_001004 [Geranomyces michiganensis]|nr:hypothetical protein HDU86_001004 [Geranomyces michiganensis]